MSRDNRSNIQPRAHRVTAALVALVLLQGVPTQAAELYRWTDSRGTVHFTDKPPKGVEAQRLDKGHTPSLASPTPAPAEPEEVDEEQKRRAERCRVERERLNTLMNSREIRMQDANGGVRVLSADEVQHEIDLSNRAIERFCRPASGAE